MLNLVVTVQVRDEHVQTFITEMGKNQAGSLKDDGCLTFDMLRSVDDPNRFQLYEVYRDAEALERHRNSPHFLAWRKVSAEILEEGALSAVICEPVVAEQQDETAGVAQVFHFDDMERIERGNGVISIPLATPDRGSRTILSGMTELPPGGEIPLHHHNTDEFAILLQGTATVNIGDDEFSVKAMDTTFVSAGILHRYKNSGDGVMRLMWIYSDPDTTRTIAATGVTLGHLDRYDAK